VFADVSENLLAGGGHLSYYSHKAYFRKYIFA
jgi:hypothetical protein